MSPGATYPYDQPDGWLCRPLPHLYFGGLPFSMLVAVSAGAATELGTKRQRTPAQRRELANNVRALLRELAHRLTEQAAPGSMNWDLTFVKVPLAEAARVGLEGEYRKGRHYVLQWAMQQARASTHHTIEFDGRKQQIGQLSHESLEGHKAAIAELDRLHRLLIGDPSGTGDRA